MSTQPDNRAPARRGIGQKALQVALLLILLGSLALNVRMILRVRELKIAADRVRIDPLGLQAYASERGKPGPAQAVVMYGDSRAEAWPSPAAVKERWVNRGVGGQSSAQALRRYAMDVSPLKPSMVIIEAGVNDLRLAGQSPESRAALVNECIDNLSALVAAAKKDGAHVVLCTVITVGEVSWKDWPYDTDAAREAVAEVNAWIRRQAADGVKIFDANASVCAGETVSPEFQADALHLNEAGYRRLNAELTKLLEEPRGEARP